MAGCRSFVESRMGRGLPLQPCSIIYADFQNARAYNIETKAPLCGAKELSPGREPWESDTPAPKPRLRGERNPTSPCRWTAAQTPRASAKKRDRSFGNELATMTGLPLYFAAHFLSPRKAGLKAVVRQTQGSRPGLKSVAPQAGLAVELR